ncbi:hypothetical protein PG996_008658 [Apiospora saccharicola]|uniref:Uncharacterized protein n=1 Tax=Apiospora saccharicola TaxID=335842 RepID=A0ABR1UYJ4_9PEZI
MEVTALKALDRWPTLPENQVARSTDESILFPEHRSESLSPEDPKYEQCLSQLLERVVQRADLVHQLYTAFKDTLPQGKFDDDEIPPKSNGEALKQHVMSEGWGWMKLQQYDEVLVGLYERMTRILLGIPHPGLVHFNTSTLSKPGLISLRRCLKVHYKELVDCVFPSKLEVSLDNDDLEKLFRDFAATVRLFNKDYRIDSRERPFGNLGIQTLLKRHTILEIVKLPHEAREVPEQHGIMGHSQFLQNLHQDIKNAYSKTLHIIAARLQDTPWFNVMETDDCFGPLPWKEGMEE